MKTKLFLAALYALSFLPVHAQELKVNQESLYLNNQPPLIKKPYMELPLGSIQAQGWLKEQLFRQKNGLTGNLDVIYEHVMGSRNGWLGGDGDVWERGPYWIDGLLPLAYILQDKDLIEKTKPWIEWAINSQKPNGYFGPDTDRGPEAGLQRNNAHDWWPKMVVLKILQQYYSATGDERVIELMLNYSRYQLQELPKTPLNHWTRWGQARGGDNLMIVYWLYNITGEKFLLNLAELIHHQTYDWTEAFTEGELRKQWNLHCVNIAQAMKEPVVYYQQKPQQKYIQAVKMGLADLRQFHGMPHGLYGADEMLHGNNPTQGSEFCTAVEMMFSMETILPVTGDVHFADYLEKVAFNALPTQATDNYDARQYFQQANQVLLTRHPRNFNTAYEGTAALFGQLTGYPCCTANMHQGWPKFTQNLWYATSDRGLAALVYAPSSVRAKVADGTLIEFTTVTNYPFEESIKFNLKTDKTVKSIHFPLHLRIPEWCKLATIKVNGEVWDKVEGNQIVKVKREWKNADVLELILPMQLTTSRWHENSVAIEHGPLVYALKIKEDWKKIPNDDRFGKFYYEVKPASSWNYGLIESFIENMDENFKIVRKDILAGTYPWNQENAPIEIQTKGVIIPFWTMYNGSAGPLPYSRQYQLKTDPPENISLIPYGCSTLRISAFPVVKPMEP